MQRRIEDDTPGGLGSEGSAMVSWAFEMGKMEKEATSMVEEEAMGIVKKEATR